MDGWMDGWIYVLILAPLHETRLLAFVLRI